ncbi:MAG TPA: hypothetical protein VHB79_26615 [Polyangiaceae bacterium]|nr:hypothetical protein [Polyangiaceae bacterium]
MDSETARCAIAHELEDVEGERPRVRCVFSVDDVVLGNVEALSEAVSLLGGVDVLLRHEGNRRSDELFAMPLERLFRHLEIGLFVYSDPGLDGGSDWQRYLRFLAVPREVAAFNGWTVFIVENGQLGRLVWRRPGHSELAQAFIEAGALDDALRAFSEELAANLASPTSVIPLSGERVKSKIRDVG